jgi:GNAT superfamily N-acetyltransferase
MNKCRYLKCNTVDENYRGLGIRKKLLRLFIEAAKKQGAQAGISHLWKQSPNNSAVAYFIQCGGKLVKSPPDKWNEKTNKVIIVFYAGMTVIVKRLK